MAGFLLKVCGRVGGEKRYDIRSDRRRLRRKEAIKKEGKRLRAAAFPSLPPSANPPHAILRAGILGKVSRLPLLLLQ